MLSDTSNAGFNTRSLHAGQQPDPTTLSFAPPIYQTTAYVFKDADHGARLFALEEFGNIYTRLQNPTWDVFEQRMAALEGGVGAMATASGQSATFLSLLNIVHAGQEIVASSTLYGGTFNLLHYTFAKMGIKVHFVDASDPENFRRAINDKTRAIFGESTGNPRIDVFPFEEVAAIAHENGLPLVIDNTMPSSYLVSPFKHGADIVVHSATKFICGHGTSIGGVIVDSGNFNWDNGKFPELVDPDESYHGVQYVKSFGNLAYIIKARVQLLRDLGAVLSPFNAFLFLQGLETLPLRMERHSQNAQKVAEFLENHPNIEWVAYPGLKSHPSHNLAKKYFNSENYGALMGIGVKGGFDAAKKFIDHLKLFSLMANMGDAKSLVIHPASTTHQQLSEEAQLEAGVTPEFVRLSVGLEDADDILADLDQALKA